MVAIMITGAVVPGVTAGTTTVTFLAKDTMMAAKPLSVSWTVNSIVSAVG
jgi:hypothetical protein